MNSYIKTPDGFEAEESMVSGTDPAPAKEAPSSNSLPDDVDETGSSEDALHFDREEYYASLLPIGMLLRKARNTLGYDLDIVASHLAIKPRHLEAVEDGRFGDLPGRTYAVGYVRAYAKYLSLDGPWAVTRFQEEAEGVHKAPKLEFKSPLPESRLPGGAIMFVSVLMSVFAYGGWYYLSSTDQTIADLVPAVPERLAVLIEDSPEVLTETPVTTAAATSGSDGSGRVVQEETQASVEHANGTAEETVAAAGTAPSTSVATVTSQQADAQRADAPETDAPETDAPETAAQETSIGTSGTALSEPSAVETEERAPQLVTVARDAPVDQADADQASLQADGVRTGAGQAIASIQQSDEPPIPAQGVGQGVEASRTALPQPRVETPAETVENTSQEAATAPAVSAPVASLIPAVPTADDGLAPINRVILKARDEVWIQVRDGDSAVVTRIMKPGDTYRVPNEPGLTLLTGSAGALDVVVDGVLVPALGPLGAVRRDISLDPASLLDRRAEAQQ